MRFLQSTWCITLQKLLKTNRLIFKVMWATFTTLATLGCINFIVSSFQNFLNYNVVTETKMIYNDSLVFPQIIFCKDNNKPDNDYTIIECTFNRINCTADFDTVAVKLLNLFY